MGMTPLVSLQISSLGQQHQHTRLRVQKAATSPPQVSMAKRAGRKSLIAKSDPEANQITRTPFTSAAIIPTQSIKYVLLHDWWLSRAEDKGLAVAGFESRGKLGVRIFSSGIIAKRHDAVTLETVDGIRITISGLINRSRTHQNGFPFEVCDIFLFGFPYDWKDYASQCYSVESAERDFQLRKPGCFEFNMVLGSSGNTSGPGSLYDLPAAKIRDLLMSPDGGWENCAESNLLDDVSVHSNMKEESPRTDVNSILCKSAGNHKRAKVDIKLYRGSREILHTKHTATQELQNTGKSVLRADILTPYTGVTTRNMTKLIKEQEANLKNLLVEDEK